MFGQTIFSLVNKKLSNLQLTIELSQKFNTNPRLVAPHKPLQVALKQARIHSDALTPYSRIFVLM